ncbi:RNase III domain-containing protein [Rhodotorula toruloides]|uniref:RNase III domain-containing protein n=1 Tax=Rhodotorula toruloides TaxID=5286 RepID=A0A2T0ACZ2_RHOTO|nr:RNase III domain-containing protein [Rhodotorula toruloides]PRQ75863.1 hypothetical protein AAT19DRAFT_12885 [Rhodotorula toruloides]
MTSSPPSQIHPSERLEVPARLEWAPSDWAFDATKLPPLPAIRDPALAEQARMSKDYAGWRDGRQSNYSRADEIASYRRLEWLGDSQLSALVSSELFMRYPDMGSAVLSKIRSFLTSNHTYSYLARAYSLDLALLQPPPPKKPGKFWRSLSETQNVAADLFEAHIGALLVEGRDNCVRDWLRTFLVLNRDELDRRISEHEAFLQAADEMPQRFKKKRALNALVFDGGSEVDPITNKRRISLLDGCPASPHLEDTPARFDDRLDHAAGWHSHLVIDGYTIGCGRGQKQIQAHDAAVFTYFRLMRGGLTIPSVASSQPRPASSTPPPARNSNEPHPPAKRSRCASFGSPPRVDTPSPRAVRRL